MISSYPSIYALGHRAIRDLFDGPVVVEEKIDGSQFSFGTTGGKLYCRSKGQEIHFDSPEKMFTLAVNKAAELFHAGKLRDGFLYRCEFLNKPKHNTLTYGRIPAGNLVLFDVMIGPEIYLSPEKKTEEALFLGLEPVPNFWNGKVELSNDWLSMLLSKESVLGGCKVEGVVIKNYDKFTVDKKIMVGKYVSKEFKEKHQHAWKQSNPSKADVVQHLILSLRTEARWNKAIQHLKEAGALTVTPQDIGKLIKEIQADVQKEEQEEIMTFLFNHFWPQIARGVIVGFPEYYKTQLGIVEAV